MSQVRGNFTDNFNTMIIEKNLEKPVVKYGAIMTNSMEFIVLHHTASNSYYRNVMNYLFSKEDLSVHYMTGKKAECVQMLEDKWLGYHAGVSEWTETKGDKIPGGVIKETKKWVGMNNFSIGIEVNSNGHEFTPDQIGATAELVKKLMKEHNIPAHRVLTHALVSYPRKWDIGPNFFNTWGGYDGFIKALHEIVELNLYQEKEEDMWRRIYGMSNWLQKYGEFKKSGRIVFNESYSVVRKNYW